MIINMTIPQSKNFNDTVDQSFDDIIGVGPHPLPRPTDKKYDPELLQNGDHRNVTDKYRYWTVSAIKDDLKQQSFPIHVAVENFQYDFNIGTIIRNANAFNVEAVHIIGKKHWNRRGAMVTDRYLEIYHHQTVADFAKAVNDRQIIAVDNTKSATKLDQFIFPENPVLVFGAEGPGLSNEMIIASQYQLAIEQFGSTRSFNVGVASGIVLYQAVQAILRHNKD